MLQPMDKRLAEYIKQVVNEYGVTSTLKMRLLLEVYLKQFIFKDFQLPPKHNKRFWPSLKDIYNHMATQFLKLRDSSVDQVCLLLQFFFSFFFSTILLYFCFFKFSMSCQSGRWKSPTNCPVLMLQLLKV
jgi:hypothetical protein